MTCENCGHDVVALREWRAMSVAERKTSGKRRKCGPYCKACYDRLRRTGPRRWKLEDLVEEAEFLFSDGLAAAQVADRLGMKHKTLIHSYWRARARGLTTRRPDYRGLK